MLYREIDKNAAGYEKIRVELRELQLKINAIQGISDDKDWQNVEKENLMCYFFEKAQNLDNNRKALLSEIKRNSSLSDFYSFAIKNNRYVSRMDEIKRGIEEGFDLSEIMIILDLPQNLRGIVKEIYMQYREYFNDLAQAGQIYKIKGSIQRRLNSNNWSAEYNKDIRERPIRKKVSVNTAEVENIPVFTGKASYIEYQRDDDPDTHWYRCFSDDGETYDTPDESVAAKWVDNKNVRMAPRTTIRRSDSSTR